MIMPSEVYFKNIASCIFAYLFKFLFHSNKKISSENVTNCTVVFTWFEMDWALCFKSVKEKLTASLCQKHCLVFMKN